MINKIIASLIFVSMLLALSIHLVGLAQGEVITHVELGAPFLSFMKSCSQDLNSFKIEIPDIPSIPPLEETSGAWAVVQVLVQFVNGLVNLLNFIVMLLNTIIELLEFIIIVIKNLITFRDSLVEGATTIV